VVSALGLFSSKPHIKIITLLVNFLLKIYKEKKINIKKTPENTPETGKKEEKQ
jgi:hypothetical protein